MDYSNPFSVVLVSFSTFLPLLRCPSCKSKANLAEHILCLGVLLLALQKTSFSRHKFAEIYNSVNSKYLSSNTFSKTSFKQIFMIFRPKMRRRRIIFEPRTYSALVHITHTESKKLNITIQYFVVY